MNKPIEKILPSFEKLNVLIVGDIMLDHYIYGEVNRISPEAPVPVVEINQHVYATGGAGNVALNIQALGANPFLCSVIGNDDIGAILLEHLAKRGIDTTYVYSSNNRKSTIKKRVLAQGQQLIRIDEECTDEMNEKDSDIFLSMASQILKKHNIDVMLFQDYNKGVLFPQTIQELLKIAEDRDVLTVVDPKQKNFFLYKKATLFKPNFREVSQQLPFSIKPRIDSLRKAADFLKKRLGHREIIITLSEKGLFYDNGLYSFIMPTTPRIIADVCGAGDTVVSVAALGIARKMQPREMAFLCNLAGGQVCEKIGVVPVDMNMLRKDCLKYQITKKLIT